MGKNTRDNMGTQSQHDNQTHIIRYVSNALPMSERALSKLDANVHVSPTKSAIASDSQMVFDGLHVVSDYSHDPLDAAFEAQYDPLDAAFEAQHDPLDAAFETPHDPLDAAFEAQHDPLDAAFETPHKCERRLTGKGKTQKKVSPKAATYRRSHGFCFPKTGTCQRSLKCAKYSITLEQL